MRKFLFLFLLIAYFPLTAAAQGNWFTSIVLSGAGRPIAGATITVCAYNPSDYSSVPPTPWDIYTGTVPCPSKASIFSNIGLTLPQVNGSGNPSFLSDGLGNYGFYGSASIYTVCITGQSVTGSCSALIGGGGSGGGPLLQTNSINNSVQTQLNLVAGTNVTITNTGGNTTINSTGGGGGSACPGNPQPQDTFCSGPAGIQNTNTAFVQQKTIVVDGTSHASTSLAFDFPVTSGDSIIAFSQCSNNGFTGETFTDSQGNTITPVWRQGVGFVGLSAFGVGTIGTTGTDTVTVSWTSGGTACTQSFHQGDSILQLTIAEYAGGLAFDTGQNHDLSIYSVPTTVTTTVTTANANELLVTYIAGTGGGAVGGTDYPGALGISNPAAPATRSFTPNTKVLQTSHGYYNAVGDIGTGPAGSYSVTLSTSACGTFCETNFGILAFSVTSPQTTGIPNFRPAFVDLSIPTSIVGQLPHINIAPTGITPGNYTNTNLTVAADGSITAIANGIGGGGVSSLNSLTGALSLTAGSGISVTPSGSTIQITNTGGGGGGSFYQIFKSNGTPQTQRSAANFTTAFTLSDSSSPSQTTVDLNTVDVPHGGTANSSLTAHSLVIGEGVSPAGLTAMPSSAAVPSYISQLAGSDPAPQLAGISQRTVAGTTDTIVNTDRANLVVYTSNSSVAVTLPQSPTTDFGSNFTVNVASTGTGTVTFTPATGTCNGVSTCALLGGYHGTLISNNTNYILLVSSTGTVTSVATTSPISGGTIIATGTLSCPTCVTASSPGAGLAHFAGSTQAVTSSAVVGSDMASNTVTATQLAVVQTRRVCTIDNDTQSATPLTTSQLTGRCDIPAAATIVEVDVWGGTGTSSVVYTGASSVNLTRSRPNGGGTSTILSGALATPNSSSNMNLACALTSTSGTCINGLTSSGSITISTTSLNAGDTIFISGATADAAQTFYTVAVVYTIN